MSLVLATGAPTASGLTYDDVPGVRYGYPRRYRRWMVPGAPFVYYRGRRAASMGVPGSVYFGAGVLGATVDDGKDVLSIEIAGYESFGQPVGLRKADGSYYETAAATNPRYWLRGVRIINDAVMADILVAAARTADEPERAAPARADPPRRYLTNRVLIEAVERYSVDIALEMLAAEFGREAVTEMPHGNPGFDISVVTAQGDELHVEVKGTQQATPVFFMSEGERLHSESQGSSYRLCVVSRIDLDRRDHVVHWHHGPVASPAVELKPRQWQGQLNLDSFD